MDASQGLQKGNDINNWHVEHRKDNDSSVLCTEKEGVQASINVLVDKELLLSLQANAEKLCKVIVPKLGDQQQLVPQLFQALP
jgi:hypothetical protein